MLRVRAGAVSLFPAAFLLTSFAALDAACGSGSAEQQLLTNFFRAARVRDNTTLANIAAVSFNPRTEGTVETFEVASVGPEQRRSLRIRTLIDEESAAKAAEAAFSKDRLAFQTANQEALQRVVRAESAKQPLRGKDAEVQASLAKYREEQAQHSRKLSDVRTQLSRERSLAVSSLTPPGQPDVDVSSMDVAILSKQVTVNAQVRTPDGRTMPRMLVFTFERAVGSGGGQTREGRWLITGLRQAS
jgi:hypothetical protein